MTAGSQTPLPPIGDLRVALLIGLVAIGTAVEAGAQLVPTERFAALPFVSQPRLSPDGSRVALLVQRQAGRELVIQPLRRATETARAAVSIPTLTGQFVDHDWVSDERLVVRVRSQRRIGGRNISVLELASVASDGGDWQRIRGSLHPAARTQRNAEVIHLLPDEPDTVLAALNDSKLSAEAGAPDVHRIDVRTGERRRVVRNGLGVHRWLADSRGVVRIGIKLPTYGTSLRSTVYARADEDDGWVELQSTGYFDRERLVPLAFDPADDNVLLVAGEAMSDPDPTSPSSAVYRFDLENARVLGPYEDPIAEEVVALVRGVSDAPLVRVVSSSTDRSRHVVRLSGPTYPPRYGLVDLSERTLGVFASAYPQLSDVVLAPTQTLTFRARDGLRIPAYLTMPNQPDAEPPALVVLPHGGPWSEDHWDFDPLVQFLANRSYAVLQPQFRGSTGQGWAHLTAGFQQWGLAIQDDINDGIAHLSDRGVIEADRVCIVGASFGGYAAAIGLARDPELFRCGVSINGVTDLARLRRDTWGLLFLSVNRAVLNPRATFAETSPIARARDFQDPLLLIAGLRDSIVPPVHSQQLFRRLSRLGKPVQLLELPQGEHWPTDAASNLATFGAIEEFLNTHLGSDR